VKLEDKVGKVIISAGMKVTNFRIKVNKHSFKQLYSGLYSDKIHAIIRELSTNAADAHVSAAKPDVPFEVHLPSEMEPYFSVKDYGTGLSPEQIAGENGIYITFFESDKSHSDDFTGCLGLGSKSPFAYTDNFMVESRYNGKRYSYVCFHNESGEPCIAQMGECDTDEPNGLKVEFAVKTDDFYEFHGKAEDVLSWFKVKPNVYGKEFKPNVHEYLRKTERYGVRKEREGHSMVVMGNVAYKVSAGDFSYNKLNDVERDVLEWGVDLFVDIGDVEFVPSREKLAMTDKTIRGVRKFLGDAIKSIQEELEIHVQKSPSVWKARRMLHDIKHSILGKVRSMTTVMYNGKEICDYISLNKFFADKLVARPLFESLSLKKSHYRRASEEKIYCDTTKIYFNDLEHGGYARITNDLRNNDTSKAYCVSGATKEFLEETGIGEVAIRASSLPKTERAKRERVEGEAGGYVKRTVLQEYVPNGGSYAGNWWNDVEVDLNAGGVYVVISYGQIVMEGEGRKRTPEDYRERYNVVKALNPAFKLLAIRPAHLEKMGKHKSKWIKFEDYLNILLKEKEHLIAVTLAYLQYEECENRDHYERFSKEDFEDHSLFGEFLEKLVDAKAQCKNTEAIAYSELNRYASAKCPVLVKKLGLDHMRRKVEEEYPLLPMVDWYGRNKPEFVKSVSEYIRALDDRRLDGIIAHHSSVREAEVHLEEAV
jgi:hypothetical protein